MATPMVVKEPEVQITFGATVIDFSDSVVAVEVGSEAETVDIGTFANPKAQEIGKVTDSITMALLWSDALQVSASPYINTEGTFKFTPDSNDASAYIQTTVKYGTLPFGRFEVGQRVESDLVLAVLDDIVYYS
jgi:hypothetical protein